MHSCHFLVKQFQMGGTICLWYLYPYIYWYFLISSYYLTVSNGHSLTAMKTRSCHFLVKQFQMGGTTCLWYLHVFSAVVFPYIFLLFDCFKWGLIDCIEKCRGHSELWQFQVGGSICLWCLHVFSMCWYFLISSYYLTVLNGRSLTALKSVEVTQSSDSFIWGGPSVCGICILIYTGISLYFLIS